MDDADMADARIQHAIEDSIAECRRKPSMIPIMACYNCGDPVPQHHIYCSSECSLDHKKRLDALMRDGK